jgi:hypothetical protein
MLEREAPVTATTAGMLNICSAAVMDMPGEVTARAAIATLL